MTDREKAIIEKLGLNEADFQPNDTVSEIRELKEQLNALIQYNGLTLKKIGGGTYEVIKETVKPKGDYLNPIPFADGDSVTKGLWYIFDDENIWECIRSGVASYSSDWFDIITL